METGCQMFLTAILFLFCKAVIGRCAVKNKSSVLQIRNCVNVAERFLRVICKPVVRGKDILHLRQIDPPFKTLKRLNIHLAVIIKEVEKAPAARLIERDGITRKKHRVVDEIAKMSPRVPGTK